MNRPFLSILDRRFKYTEASKTDIRKTFSRIKKERQEEQAKLHKITQDEIRRTA